MTAAELTATIRAARERLGLTQAAAAEAAGVSQVTWHHVERGTRSVRPETLLAMAAAVGLSARHVPERYEIQKSRKLSGKAIKTD